MQFKEYFLRHAGSVREAPFHNGECSRDIPINIVSYDSTPSSACRGQKRGCNLNMHIDQVNQSNKSVKREPLAQHKRELPVVWGMDIITKYPKPGHIIDRSSSVSICTRPPD